jgi:hypothetical protein
MGARVFVLQLFARTALLLAWSLVAWGALLVLVTLAHAMGEGPGPALGRLLPSRGDSLWAWLNALSAALAVGVGLLAGGRVAWSRRASSSGGARPDSP